MIIVAQHCDVFNAMNILIKMVNFMFISLPQKITYVCVLVTQLCPTLCNLMDCNPPGSSVHGIRQTRILEWIAISFSRVSSQIRNQTHVSCIAGGFSLPLLLLSRFRHVRLCVTPETVAHQAPPSLGFSRQEHWTGLPFPSPMHESEK